MTNSNKRHQSGHQSPSLSTSITSQTNDAYIAALPAKMCAVVTALVCWLINAVPRSKGRLGVERFISTKSGRAAMMALVLLLAVLPGTREQKNTLLEKLVAKANEKLDCLYAKYLVWRQRKCWMWGGGFRCATLARVTDMFTAANDCRSYDALIPN